MTILFVRSCCLFAFALAFVALPALTQNTTTGQIRRTITDPSGAGIPGAEIAAKDNATGIVRSVRSTASGDYTVLDLQSGKYQLTVAIAGFEKAVVGNVVVDTGIQYACGDYVGMLYANHMVASMSRPANPYDNAACESFMKTLKQEEIYCNQYKDFEELSTHLEEFIDNYYNRLRLHSALGYRTPEEFERDAAGTLGSGGSHQTATVKYFKPNNREPQTSS